MSILRPHTLVRGTTRTGSSLPTPAWHETVPMLYMLGHIMFKENIAKLGACDNTISQEWNSRLFVLLTFNVGQEFWNCFMSSFSLRKYLDWMSFSSVHQNSIKLQTSNKSFSSVHQNIKLPTNKAQTNEKGWIAQNCSRSVRILCILHIGYCPITNSLFLSFSQWLSRSLHAVRL